MKADWWSGGKPPLNLTSAVDGGQWSALRPGPLKSRK